MEQNKSLIALRKKKAAAVKAQKWELACDIREKEVALMKKLNIKEEKQEVRFQGAIADFLPDIKFVNLMNKMPPSGWQLTIPSSKNKKMTPTQIKKQQDAVMKAQKDAQDLANKQDCRRNAIQIAQYVEKGSTAEVLLKTADKIYKWLITIPK